MKKTRAHRSAKTAEKTPKINRRSFVKLLPAAGVAGAAMTSLEAFYDAVGDKAKLRANQTRMVESCQRFIDFDKIDVIPTSEYVLRA